MDREQIKKELKQEIKEELLSELRGGKFDFEAYKTQVTNDDINKLEKYLEKKNPWYYFIPFLGFILWLKTVTIMLSSIDRGTFRKNIVELSMSFWPIVLYWIPMILLIGMLFNYGPLMARRYGRIVINKTKNELNK